MATYQVVPYLISVHPRGSRGAEVLPLDDLDGGGTTLADLISYTLTAAVGAGPFYFPNVDDKSFRIASTSRAPSALYFAVTQGNRGIQSRMNDNGEVVFERKSNHIEDIDFRNLIVFPRGGHHALLLTERIGNFGVSTFLRKLLTDSLRVNYNDVTTEVKALTTAADLTNTNIMLRGIEFQFPHPNDPSARRMDLSRPDGHLAIKYRFGSPTRLSNYTNDDGTLMDPSKVFGVLDPGLSEVGLNLTGERMKELGSQADLQVTLPSGNHRSFTLGVEEGPALAYRLEPSGQPGDGSTDVDRFRPSDTDFIRVSKEAVSDVGGSFGVSESTLAYCAIPEHPDSVVVPSGWEVVWNVPDHIAPSGA